MNEDLLPLYFHTSSRDYFIRLVWKAVLLLACENRFVTSATYLRGTVSVG